ncbi:MAG: type II secretion system F family protein [Pseudomonadota bacterium]|nr:type II secretion system F family protein [Pseudomonadota bacterium]
MFDLIDALLQPDRAIALLVALSVFATVLSIAGPMLQGDKLRGRMKLVSQERDRLRTQHKMNLAPGEGRLRDKPKGILLQLVDGLNLRKVFEAESSREKLRQAGLRSERHLLAFFAIRLVTPVLVALLVFVYSSTVFADRIPQQMRIVSTLIGLVFGMYLPGILLKNIVQRRQKSIQRAWSDALDLLLICVESGMAIEPAMQRVSREIGSQSVPLAEELTLTHAELSYLQDRRKAFENLGKRTGLPTVKSVVTSLIQSERYGTPLGTALRVLAQENRDARMQEAERRAAALPPKLTVPMILFFLPVIFIVILGPSAILVMDMRN